MRDAYDVKESYTGTGLLAAYTFDFKIEALSQLLIIERDDTGLETQRVRGTDVTYLSSVTFDAVEGGGTVNLAANLDVDYTLTILLANDAPTQPFQFKNQNQFTLRKLESALDWAVGCIQRLTYRGKQALRLDDINDEETVDSRILNDGVISTSNLLSDNAARSIRVNDAGDGFQFGLTLAELLDALLPTASITNQIIRWNGASWVADLFGGGQLVSATQSIASGGNITVNASIQQLLKVQGNGGVQIAGVTPFTGTLRDGMIITLLGMSDANILTIQYADISNGCLLKGDCYLSKGHTLTVVYDLATLRFYEIARN